MLTDASNRYELASSLAAYAVTTGLCAMTTILPRSDADLLFVMMIVGAATMSAIGTLAWLWQTPVIRRIENASILFGPMLAHVLFIVGVIGVVGFTVLACLQLGFWPYVLCSLLSGYGAWRQFQKVAAESAARLPPPPPTLASAHLID